VSARNGGDALARSQSVSARKKPVDSIVHLLLQTNQVAKVLILVRQKRVSATDFATALSEGRRPDVLHALRMPIEQFNTTVAHELARQGRPAHVAWLCTEVPELLHAREPLTNSTVLHTIALMRSDNDEPKLIEMLWARVNVKLLTQKDKAGCTAAHYLGMKGAFQALEIVNARMGATLMQRSESANNGETPTSLAMTQMKRALDTAKRENARLLHNTQVAESTAEELKAMHVELDDAIKKRDADIKRRDAEIVAMRERVTSAVDECEALRARQKDLDAQSRAQTAALDRAQSEAQATRERATSAERRVEQLQGTLLEGDEEADNLVLERDELHQRLRAKEAELAEARDGSDARVDEIELERDAMLREQSELAERAAANEAERARLRAQLDDAADEHERLENELVESRSRLSAAALDAEQLRAKSAALEQSLAERGDELAALAHERDELRAEATRATEQAERATKAAERHAEALRAVRDSEDADMTVIEETELAIEAAERELEAARKREAALREDAERRDTEARESMGALESQLGVRATEIAELQAHLRESRERADREARERDEAMKRMEEERNAAQAAALAAHNKLLTVPTAAPASGASAHGTLRRTRPRSSSVAQSGLAASPRRYGSLKRERANSSESSCSEVGKIGAKEAALRAAVNANTRRNAQLNRHFFRKLFDAVRGGDVALVTRYLDLGVSVNTRSAVVDSLETGGRPLLEVAVYAARDASQSSKMVGEKESRALIESLARVVRLLLESGADWLGLDDYITSHGTDLPPKVCKLLRARDDCSPFCQALLANNEERALLYVDMVEDFSRVPSKHSSDKLSYLHLAVAGGHARLVQQMLATGNCKPNQRDAKDRAPLHIALQKITDVGKRRLVVECLLAAGAYPTLPSSYQKLSERARRATQSKGLSSPLTRSAAGNNEASKFGTPLALAEATADTELAAMMRDRRYLRITIDAKEAADYNAPLLQEYIQHWVTLHVGMEQLLESGAVSDTSGLYRVYQRYCDVFGCFNRNLHGRVGYKLVLERIYAEAGVDDRYAAQDDVAQTALEKMVGRDESVVAQEMNASNSVDNAAAGNASQMWNVCKLLMQCTKAVTGRWFEVDRMIEEPACALYDRAVRITLANFVRENKVAEIDWMVNRNDALFGDLSLDSVVDAKLGLTCMELATHYGIVDVLDYFLERQRGRIDTANADGRTLVMIALTAYQPISIVAIDQFKWRAHMSATRHANAEHYGLLTRQMRNSVLHQCVQQCRPDLLRFCADKVAFQLERKNANGHTPVQIAKQLLQFQKRDESVRARYERCIRIIVRRVAGESDSESSSGGPGTASATPRDNATLVSDISMAVHNAAKEALAQSAEPETPRTKERRRRHRREHRDREHRAEGKETSRRHHKSKKSKKSRSGADDDDESAPAKVPANNNNSSDEDVPPLPPPPALQPPPTHK